MDVFHTHVSSTVVYGSFDSPVVEIQLPYVDLPKAYTEILSEVGVTAATVGTFIKHLRSNAICHGLLIV